MLQWGYVLGYWLQNVETILLGWTGTGANLSSCFLNAPISFIIKLSGFPIKYMPWWVLWAALLISLK